LLHHVRLLSLHLLCRVARTLNHPRVRGHCAGQRSVSVPAVKGRSGVDDVACCHTAAHVTV
jgi:hypothetical protein